ncbi:MAG: endonuclease Q family protein [Bacillota bacterium]
MPRLWPDSMRTPGPVRADLHVHLGRAPDGRPVKIPASPALTLENVLGYAREKKGLDAVGIVDMQVPSVHRRVKELLEAGELARLPGGGYQVPGGPWLLPGCELEVAGPGGPVHLLTYFPDLDALADFAAWLGEHVDHLELSSQRCRAPAPTVAMQARERGGMVIPAHVFTPHRSLYGGGHSLSQLFGEEAQHIAAVELGLSADTALASQLSELGQLRFISASDAHSLERIGRELTVFAPEQPGCAGLFGALQVGGIVSNYGLDPRLGKYHRSYCLDCRRRLPGDPPVLVCAHPGHRVVKGVLDRICQLADVPASLAGRPPYLYQVPLADLPGVGPGTRARLRELGDDFHILHVAEPGELARAVGVRLSRLVLAAREGRLEVEPGGGGYYGRVRERE